MNKIKSKLYKLKIATPSPTPLNPKFRYDDRIIVKNGFLRGYRGRILNYHENEKIYYVDIFKRHSFELIAEDNLDFAPPRWWEFWK